MSRTREQCSSSWAVLKYFALSLFETITKTILNRQSNRLCADKPEAGAKDKEDPSLALQACNQARRIFIPPNFVIHQLSFSVHSMEALLVGGENIMSSQVTTTIEPASANPSPSDSLSWWRGWLPLLVLPGLVVALFPSSWPRWSFMWAVAFAIYCGCKWLTYRRTPVSGVAVWKQVAYLFAWPGMDAKTFLTTESLPKSARPTFRDWLVAWLQTGVGFAVLYGITRVVPSELSYLQGWVGMFALVLILHFGLFRILRCFWQSLGIGAQPVMNAPILSTSLSEFWGRRWNVAFRDLTHRFLFRPLRRWLGHRWSLFVGFVMSGLVHDLVISVPARGGYGLPTLFFLLQGTGIFVERSKSGKRLGLGKGWTGWLFTAVLLLGPACLLFHVPFVERIVLPFLEAIGAISHE